MLKKHNKKISKGTRFIAYDIKNMKTQGFIIVDSFTEEDYISGLAYLKTCYGADAYTNEELISML